MVYRWCRCWHVDKATRLEEFACAEVVPIQSHWSFETKLKFANVSCELIVCVINVKLYFRFRQEVEAKQSHLFLIFVWFIHVIMCCDSTISNFYTWQWSSLIIQNWKFSMYIISHEKTTFHTMYTTMKELNWQKM